MASAKMLPEAFEKPIVQVFGTQTSTVSPSDNVFRRSDVAARS
jgi:hypothetical protein